MVQGCVNVRTGEVVGEAAPKARGFGNLRCPLCGEEGLISLDLDDGATFRCGQCEDTFDAKAARAMIDPWERVLAWVSTCPTRD
jgi:transcription elongation factor Elf1